MKKFYLFLFPVFILTISFSCTKKSPNDPLVSLLTRNQRITGEWKLVSLNSTNSTIYNTGGTNITTYSFDGNIRTIDYYNSYPDFQGGFNVSEGTNRELYSKIMEIKKDGTWEINETFENISSGSTSNLNSNGIWHWTNTNNKKTGIELYGNSGGYRQIDKLSNKKLTLSYNIEKTSNDSTDYNYEVAINESWEKQ